ncbi:MAG: copper chaperone PCu(A)C [Gallionella sp.]|nr:copper chaperone PCu(A)C [Gallionella sp.]
MRNPIRFGWLVTALLLSVGAYAGDIQVEGAWARATVPGQDSGMVDLSITSKQAASLIGVYSPVAGSVELHSMTHEGGMMKMREVKSIELPAGKTVNLGQSGYHVMLNGLKAPLKAGENLPLTLNIRISGNSTVKIKTRAEIKPLVVTVTDAPPANNHMHH